MTLFETWDAFEESRVREELKAVLLLMYDYHGAEVILDVMDTVTDTIRVEETYGHWDRYDAA